MDKITLQNRLNKMRNELLLGLNSGKAVQLSTRDSVLLYTLTTQDVNTLSIEQIIMAIDSLIERLESGNNYLYSATNRSVLLGTSTYSILQGGKAATDYSSIILHHIEYLIGPKREVKGDTPIQKLMSMDKAIIRNTLASSPGRIEYDPNKYFLNEIPTTKIRNFEDLENLVGADNDFIIFVPKSAILVYTEYGTNEQRVMEYSRDTGTFTEKDIDDLTLYIPYA